jgi:tRNA(Arg) A34 adenosine deaminase TadA
MSKDFKFLRRAIELSKEGMDQNAGGPFGAVIVKNNSIISEAFNQVTSTNDPTAHAEVLAIRRACHNLKTFQLEGCTIYTSCEPCPMCLGAIYWARPDRVVYACTKEDAKAIDFDDAFIYSELDLLKINRSIPFEQALREEGKAVFKQWTEKEDRTEY